MPLHSYSYLSSFEILSEDFRRATEYIEPTDDNLDVYSHRLYELLLRACTDFESICKEELINSRYQWKGKSPNIYDYRTLEKEYNLEQTYIGILLWRPLPIYIRPFDSWSTNAPPLSWYDAYNQVKHNRNADFAYASLDNVTMALAGLFAMLVSLGVLKQWRQERDVGHGLLRERVYSSTIFSWAWEKGINSGRKTTSPD